MQRGFTLVEMLVALMIVAVLGAFVAVPNMHLSERRAEAAAERLELATGQAMRLGRAGERWQLIWFPEALELRRGDDGQVNRIALPEGSAIRRVSLEGTAWPPRRPFELTARGALFQIELDLAGRTRVLRALPTGRLERIDPNEPGVRH